jgi:NADH:ubiquinone reductase (H+-translocating)
MSTPHRVVVIGARFGGLFATKHPKSAPVEVTVIDRTTHHLFQPLLYQVATGILSEGEIAPPIRDLLRHQHNARVVSARSPPSTSTPEPSPRERSAGSSLRTTTA